MKNRGTFRAWGAWPKRLAALAAGATLLVSGGAFAAAPTTSLIEGVMTSSGGGAAADGTYDVTFSLWEAQSGGSAIWSEGPVKVTVKGGQFSYALGTSKALDIKKIAALKGQWLGVKIGTDPMLPRQKVHSSLFALWAGTAGSLTCTGCITSNHIANGSVPASKMGFTYAGSSTKGGPASDLACTGCVSVKEMKFDADINLGKQSLAAATVTANTFIGDGSKLTGIKIPSGTCSKTGEVVKGINADGTLKCVKALDPTALPADGIDEISNGLISNQFTDEIAATGSKVLIPDNQGTDAVWNLTFPNIGKAQAIDVHVKVENTDLSAVAITLLPPDDKKTGWTLCDPCGKKDSKKYDKVFNPANPPQKQAGTGKKIADWIGQNPTGLWTLKVSDTAFCIPQATGNAIYCDTQNKKDGWISFFSIKLKTLSNGKIAQNGDLYVGGKIWGKDNGYGKPGGPLVVGGDLQVDGNISGDITMGKVKAKYGMFQQYSVPYLYRYQVDHSGGNWVWDRGLRTNYARDVQNNNEYLRRMNMELKFGSRAGNITRNHNWTTRSDSTNEGQMNIVLFIKNTTGKAITHNICYSMSGRDNSARRSSFSLNNKTIRDYNGNGIPSYCDNVTFPANKSSMLSLQCGGYYWTGNYATYWGTYYCHFYNSRLGYKKYTSSGLPAGLEYDYERYFDYVTY